MAQEVHSQGDAIFREGDQGRCAYLIERGAVELYVGDRARILSRLGPGDIFGEVAIIEKTPRSATAVAMEETVLTVINGDDLSIRMEHSDPVVVHLMKTLIRRLVEQRGGGIDLGLKSSFGDSAIRELLTESEIRDGLERSEFEPFFQPIVTLGDRVVRGYEALVRWRRADGRFAMPGDFLPVAERNERIQAIDLHILNAACSILSRCGLPGAKGEASALFVSVNLAPAHFRDHAIVRELERAIAYHGISPRQLKVELTETALLTDLDTTIEVINAIRDLGVRICLDDFGTGYSSLGYLYRIPIDTVKIDRSFVIGMGTSQRARKLVKAIIDIAAALGLETVVEGVETEDIAVQLKTLGCSHGQGYLFGRPMEASRLLARHGRDVLAVP